MQNPISLFKIFILLSLLIALDACRHGAQKAVLSHSVEMDDSCMTEGIHRYKVYIPSVPAKCKVMPILLIIDPHGNASLAIHRFMDGAEKYKYILVASASLKNNYPNFAHSINILLDDVKKKYPVSESCFIAGFSGGARMALAYAEFTQTEGIIACGALATPEQLNAVKSTVFAMVGMADFNFIESAQYIFKPEEAPANLRIEVTRDMHAWPSSNQLTNALGYLNTASKNGNQCCKEKIVFRNFAALQRKRIDTLRLSDDYISAGLIARNLANLEEFSTYDDFISIRNSIEYSTEFNYQLEQLKESLRYELKVRDAYYSALNSKDAAWWSLEISSLDQKMKTKGEKFKELTYQRIKGFLGIMCYSLCNSVLNTDDIQNASRLLKIYQLVEPENSDMYYDYALYYQKIQVPDSISSYLKKAVNAGFSDEQKLTRDFPIEFTSGLINHK
jgi:hypothetical protein